MKKILFHFVIGVGLLLLSSQSLRAQWVQTSGPEGGTISALVTNGDTVFAGTYGDGILFSTDKGASWTDFNSGLNDMFIQALTVNGAYLYAGTEGSSVWRRPLSDVGVISSNSQNIPPKLSCFKITAPTRSNHNMLVTLSFPNSEPVTVKIYKLSGLEIASLVDKTLDRGSHSFSWNIRNIAPGCYMVRMQAGSNTFVKSIPIVW
jgi:hypothetical protein